MSSSDLSSRLVTPGVRLCPADEQKYASGPGTYVLNGFIYSCLLGRVKLNRIGTDKDGNKEKVRGTIVSGANRCL